jgi:hypothetical protein
MAHSFDLDNEAWDDRKDGEIWKVQPLGEEVPVTVTLQWHKGGWNRIYEVHIGSVNTYEKAFNERRLTPPEPTGFEDLDKLPWKQSERYLSDIPDKFLDSLPTIVRRTQRDIEGTRKAVQLLRGDADIFFVKRGYLAQYWASDDSNKDLVAFRLRELLKSEQVPSARDRTWRLLTFEENDVSFRTFCRMLVRGERLHVKHQANKKTPNTKAKKGSAK